MSGLAPAVEARTWDQTASANAGDVDARPRYNLWARQHAGALALLAIGVTLRVWQYASDSSMWFDELSIARNLHERSLTDLLLHPLGYQQIAPVGFIALEKVDSLLLGSSDLALRLPLLLIGLAALVLFWRTAARVLQGPGLLLALALFAVCIPLVRYSAELKQYGLDIAVTLALTLLTLQLRSRTPTLRQCLAAGLAGFVSVWFSQAAVLVLAGLGAALTLCWILDRDPRSRLPVLATVPVWVVAAGIGTYVAFRHSAPATLAFMHAFWHTRQAFLPFPISWPADAVWFWDRVDQFFSSKAALRYPLPYVYTALVPFGFGILWRRQRDTALILLGPVLVTLGASIVQQFPFFIRVVLFVLPTFLLALAAAIDWIRREAAKHVHPAVGAATSLALLGPPVYATVVTPPPYFYEGFKPVFAYVQAHYRPGDAVYVYANAYEAAERYGPRFGLPPASYVAGTCDEHDVRPYLADVDRFRGAPRLWVIGASVPDFHHPRYELARYLQTIGVRHDSVAIASAITNLDPVGAELYDLSDPKRLAAAHSTDFAVGPFPTKLRPLCLDWVRPTPDGADRTGSAVDTNR